MSSGSPAGCGCWRAWCAPTVPVGRCWGCPSCWSARSARPRSRSTTNTIWQMGDALGRPAAHADHAARASSAWSAWLIIAHDLWEKPSGDTPRELARLFNLGTGLTLGLAAGGVLPGAVRRNRHCGRAAHRLIGAVPEPAVGRSARPTTRCSRGSSPRWPRSAAPSAPASRTRRTCVPPPTATTRHPPGGATRRAGKPTADGAAGAPRRGPPAAWRLLRTARRPRPFVHLRQPRGQFS